MRNQAVILRSRPTGIAQAEHFAIEDVPVAAPEAGQILVRNIFLSVEPAMRGWIADAGNYSDPVPIGSVMRALAVGHVATSRHPDYREGDVVSGWFGWQTYATVTAKAVVRKVKELDLPVSLSLGVLGINGVTAHLALSRDHRDHDGIARGRLLHRDDGGGRADPVRRAAANLFRVVRLSDRFREQPLDHPFDLAFQSALREGINVLYRKAFILIITAMR